MKKKYNYNDFKQFFKNKKISSKSLKNIISNTDDLTLINKINKQKKIEEFLKINKIYNTEIIFDNILDDFCINVNGDVTISDKNLIFIPFKFNIVNGDFYLRDCLNLKTLENLPNMCNNIFIYKCNSIKNLVGLPKKLKQLECSFCENLETLYGGPTDCENYTLLYCKKLKNLEYISSNVKYINCSYCNNLESLKGLPQECHTIILNNCENLKSFKYISKKIINLECINCNSLDIKENEIKYLPQKCNYINIKNSNKLISKIDILKNNIIYKNINF